MYCIRDFDRTSLIECEEIDIIKPFDLTHLPFDPAFWNSGVPKQLRPNLDESVLELVSTEDMVHHSVVVVSMAQSSSVERTSGVMQVAHSEVIVLCQCRPDAGLSIDSGASLDHRTTRQGEQESPLDHIQRYCNLR